MNYTKDVWLNEVAGEQRPGRPGIWTVGSLTAQGQAGSLRKESFKSFPGYTPGPMSGVRVYALFVLVFAAGPGERGARYGRSV